jgi:hypothetical protein
MSDGRFPQPESLLDDVTQFGVQAVNDYFTMSGDANCWEIPERWPQNEIARRLWDKHRIYIWIYIWLELPIAKVLGWMNSNLQGKFVGEADQISAAMAASLGIGLSAVSCRRNAHNHRDGYAFGFIAAML